MSGSVLVPVEIALAVAGVVGVSGFSAAYRFGRSWTRQYRFLRLHRTEPLEIVLPTSERKESEIGIKYTRSVTSLGNLRGATQIAQAVGRISRLRRISVSVSEEIESDLQGDLVILGLPRKNAASRMVLEALREGQPQAGLEIVESEDGGNSIELAGHEESYAFEQQSIREDYPTRDVALIVAWVNPLAPRRRRLLLCAGFTTYGTAKAASYLVHEIPAHRYRALRRGPSGGALPSLLSLHDWPCFAMLVEMKLINDQVVDVRQLAFTPLQDPWRR